MPLYFPRMAASLTVPIVGASHERVEMGASDAVVELPVRVHSVSISKTDLNKADSATLDVEFADAPVDPRVLQSASVRIWIGDGQVPRKPRAPDDPRPPEPGVGLWQWEPNDDELRFVGVMTTIGRALSEGTGWTVSMAFDDLTALFLESKHYPPEGVPLYSMTLSQAWAHICDHTGPLDSEGNITSTVRNLRNVAARPLDDGLVFEGGAQDIVIGRGLPPRFLQAPLATHPDGDSWALWQEITRRHGLISFIRRNQCVITTNDAYYAGDLVRFAVGENVSELSERRNEKFGGKGVGVTCFDALTGTTLEGLFPPPGDPRAQKKKIGAPSRKPSSTSSDDADQSEEREYFALAGITSQDQADAVAERIWQERSRQEIEGSFATHEMTVETADLDPFDVLSLEPGQPIYIDVQHAMEEIEKIDDMRLRVERLVFLGFSERAAELAARNLSDLGQLNSVFYTKGVDIVFQTSDEDEGGEAEITIHFVNRYSADQSGHTDMTHCPTPVSPHSRSPSFGTRATRTLRSPSSPGDGVEGLFRPATRRKGKQP